MNPGSFPDRDKIFSSPKYPEELWDPPCHPVNGYEGLFHQPVSS